MFQCVEVAPHTCMYKNTFSFVASSLLFFRKDVLKFCEHRKAVTHTNQPTHAQVVVRSSACLIPALHCCFFFFSSSSYWTSKGLRFPSYMLKQMQYCLSSVPTTSPGSVLVDLLKRCVCVYMFVCCCTVVL